MSGWPDSIHIKIVGDEWHDFDCGIAGGFPHRASDHDDWTPSEPAEVIAEFTKLLRGPTGDGASKRRSGDKVSWKVDPGHIQAAFRHIGYWSAGEQADKDSGCHPLVHAAWRFLAIAWQENQDYDKSAN